MHAQRYNCPVELALTLLGGKWKVVLLARLKDRPHRYAELRAATPGISDKVLTERLRQLIDSGLVLQSKRGRRGAPSSYRLSQRAELLRPALEALYQWGLAEARDTGATFLATQSAVETRAP
ncbi:MAG: helix-turn-helix domain-containing protein [Polyangiaceae bacterium]